MRLNRKTAEEYVGRFGTSEHLKLDDANPACGFLGLTWHILPFDHQDLRLFAIAAQKHKTAAS